jgi:hypothetical protein
VDIRENHAAIAPQGYAAQDFAGQGFAAQDLVAQRAPMGGFTMEDILWAAGIWSVILTLSPVILFYMLMVA